jgi:putative hydrolase of the HAD superfamily
VAHDTDTVRFDAVLFDLDDTLLDGDAAWASGMDSIVRRRCPDVDRAAAFAAWEGAFDAHFDDYLAGRMSLAESRAARIRTWGSALGVAIEPGSEAGWFADYLVGYSAGWRPFDDVAAVLGQLAPRQLGVVTNGDGDQQRAKVAALRLPVTFDVVVVSSEVGCAKPDRRIFRTAAEKLEVAPARCVFVGDREDVDAAGAHDAGMHGVWLNRRGRSGVTDLPSISTLADLPALLTTAGDGGVG